MRRAKPIPQSNTNGGRRWPDEDGQRRRLPSRNCKRTADVTLAAIQVRLDWGEDGEPVCVLWVFTFRGLAEPSSIDRLSFGEKTSGVFFFREWGERRERGRVRFLPNSKNFTLINVHEFSLFIRAFSKNAHNARQNTTFAVELHFRRTTSRRSRFDAIYDTCEKFLGRINRAKIQLSTLGNAQ